MLRQVVAGFTFTHPQGCHSMRFINQRDEILYLKRRECGNQPCGGDASLSRQGISSCALYLIISHNMHASSAASHWPIFQMKFAERNRIKHTSSQMRRKRKHIFRRRTSTFCFDNINSSCATFAFAFFNKLYWLYGAAIHLLLVAIVERKTRVHVENVLYASETCHLFWFCVTNHCRFQNKGLILSCCTDART